MNSSTPAQPKPAHHPPVNVTFQIEDEPEHPAPSLALTIAFGISFVPLLGLLGGGYAAWDLWSSARNKITAHGLAYATLAIQLLYVVLGITLYLVVFQLPLLNNSSLNDPAVQSGHKFLMAVKNGNQSEVLSSLDPSFAPSFESSLTGYQSSIQYNPQLVLAEAVATPKYPDANLSAYNGRPASFQMWRVGTNQTTSHYYVLTIAQDITGKWVIVGMIGFDAGGEDTARTLARQNKNSTFGL